MLKVLLFLLMALAFFATAIPAVTASVNCEENFNQGQLLVTTENGGASVIWPTASQTSSAAAYVQSAQVAPTTRATVGQIVETVATLSSPRHPLILSTVAMKNEAGFSGQIASRNFF